MQLRPRVSALPCLRWPLGARHGSTNSPTIKSKLTLKGHWSPERLRPNTEYPLSLELSTRPVDYDLPVRSSGYFPADILFSTRTRSYARTQIVSPDLCGMLPPSAVVESIKGKC